MINIAYSQDLKSKIVSYWSGRAPKFSQLRRDELNSAKRELWLAELKRWLPVRRPLDVLDIGTGTGFFCFLLESEGCRVTGIDLSPEMIADARKIAREAGMKAEFHIMDAEKPDFAPRSFDAIVTRNLTCFLPDLPRAYQQWRELLRDGGVLINFDADYNYDETKHELPPHHSHEDLTRAQNVSYELIRAEMKKVQRSRPQWDVELLENIGFSRVSVDHTVSAHIYREFDRFYNPVPLFAVVAWK